MEYTILGRTGLTVSKLCLGTWRFGRETDGTIETTEKAAHDLLTAAWDQGITFIDTANGYGTPSGTAERWIGDWLDGYDRTDVVLASKVYWDFERGYPHRGGLSRRDIRHHLAGTLERLGTDYLDLYYLHRWDEKTPIERTLRTLEELRQEGRIDHIGLSTMAAWQLTKALWACDRLAVEPFSVAQPQFNAAYREPVADYLDACADQDLAVCPYSPTHGGLLTGKYSPEGTPPPGSRGALESWDEGRFTPREWRVQKAVEAVADEMGATPAQVALRWLIDRKRVSCVPIIGVRTVEQLRENCGATEINLGERYRAQIDRAYLSE